MTQMLKFLVQRQEEMTEAEKQLKRKQFPNQEDTGCGSGEGIIDGDGDGDGDITMSPPAYNVAGLEWTGCREETVWPMNKIIALQDKKVWQKKKTHTLGYLCPWERTKLRLTLLSKTVFLQQVKTFKVVKMMKNLYNTFPVQTFTRSPTAAFWSWSNRQKTL